MDKITKIGAINAIRKYIGPVAAALIAGIAVERSRLPHDIQELAIYLSVAIMGMLVWFIQRIVEQQTNIAVILDNHLSTLHEQQQELLGTMKDVKISLHEHDAWEREQLNVRLRVLEKKSKKRKIK